MNSYFRNRYKELKCHQQFQIFKFKKLLLKHAPISYLLRNTRSVCDVIGFRWLPRPYVLQYLGQVLHWCLLLTKWHITFAIGKDMAQTIACSVVIRMNEFENWQDLGEEA